MLSLFEMVDLNSRLIPSGESDVGELGQGGHFGHGEAVQAGQRGDLTLKIHQPAAHLRPLAAGQLCW